MTHPAYLSATGSKARSRLTGMLQNCPMLRAGLVSMARSCGKKGCKCARGEKHVSLYVSLKVGRTRKMIYVPPAMEGQVRTWAANYREAAVLWEKMLQEYLEQLLKEKTTQQASSPVRRRRSARDARPL